MIGDLKFVTVAAYVPTCVLRVISEFNLVFWYSRKVMKWGQARSFFKMYSSGGKNKDARTLSLLQYLQRLSRYSTVQSSRYYPKTLFSSPHNIPFYHNKCVVHAWHNVTVWCMYIIVQNVHTHTPHTTTPPCWFPYNNFYTLSQKILFSSSDDSTSLFSFLDFYFALL